LLEGEVRAAAPAGVKPLVSLSAGFHYRVTHDYAQALKQYALGQRVAPRDAELLVATALTEQTLGQWEASLQHLEQAQSIDPRSVNTARRLARTLMWLRRYPEALRVSDQGLALAPANLELLENKATVHLAQGDLAGAQGVQEAAPKELDPAPRSTSAPHDRHGRAARTNGASCQPPARGATFPSRENFNFWNGGLPPAFSGGTSSRPRNQAFAPPTGPNNSRGGVGDRANGL
jgi:tetratricopeptide (TPR) repeat protein